MTDFNRKNHWENIYATKQPDEVSWYQPKPETSIEFILKANPNKDASIIDIGGGDSFLVDHLLALGFTQVTVLDISAKAIDRAKERLGDQAAAVTWIESDILDFTPRVKYDIWHDRAAFHFLTQETEVSQYVELVKNAIAPTGNLIIGTFSEQGPTKCSGIDIIQYSEKKLNTTFGDSWKNEETQFIEHLTPFGTSQNFVFSSFKRDGT